MIILRLELEEFSISLFTPKGIHLAKRTCIKFLVLQDKASPRFEEVEWVPRLDDPKQNFFYFARYMHVRTVSNAVFQYVYM